MPQLTHQGNPVGVERSESHLRDELGAGEQQEVEVEEVFELVKQHLQWRDRRHSRLVDSERGRWVTFQALPQENATHVVPGTLHTLTPVN